MVTTDISLSYKNNPLTFVSCARVCVCVCKFGTFEVGPRSHCELHCSLHILGLQA